MDRGRMSDRKGKGRMEGGRREREYGRMKEGQRRKNGGMALRWLSRHHRSHFRKVGRFDLSESLGMGLPVDILVKDLGPYGHVFPGMVKWCLPPCKPKNIDPQ